MRNSGEIKKHKIVQITEIGRYKQLVIVKDMLAVDARTKSYIYLAYTRELKFVFGIFFLPYWSNETFIDYGFNIQDLKRRALRKLEDEK